MRIENKDRQTDTEGQSEQGTNMESQRSKELETTTELE